MKINKTKGYLISGIFILILTLTTLFLIFLFMHPKVYFSKASGFSQHDGVKAGKNKLRFVVPETIDTTKSTYISVKQEWFETNRMGRITDIKVKPGKHLALDFTDREYDSEVFTIYTKNWFGIKREHDVIVDYSNFLRIFFRESHTGEAPRKPIILPYSKLQTEYKHIYEELYKINSFVAFDEKGLASGQPVSRDEVFTKENAHGRAFTANNNTHISLVYDFVLPGIFKNQAQKTQVYDLVEKTISKAKTYDPEKEGLEIKFNTSPFYISKFLGWYYIDPAGNRVDLNPGQEFQIPKWATSELRLIARYDISTDTDKIGPELDKQGLVAISYFDGIERVFFDIVKKGTPLKEHIYRKEGYAYAGWYKDSALTQKVDFTKELATTHTVLYLKSTKLNQPQPEAQYHTINFITPSDANQLFPTRRAHGQKLETNYLTPSLVSRLDANGNLEELDYWTIVDSVSGVDTGKRFDFNTPITEDITLKAVMRKRVVPSSKYTIKRYFESVDQAGNFVEDKTKEEVVEGQTPGQEVELSPTQTNAPEGFTLVAGTQTKKKINKDGTTVFELRYTRNRYKVNFEVNYNGNHFKDVNVSATPEQTVPHEGKLTRPANPTITKTGYTYTFKHWQLKDEMGNVYKEVSAFDFANTKITKSLTLVAYFEEKKDTATYTVKHIFQGIQNQIEERIEEKKFTEQVGKSITVSQENRDKNYDDHFEVADFTETKKVEADGSTVFEIRYARKKYKVNFEVNYNNHFADAQSSQEAEQEIPYEGKVMRPHTNPSLEKSGYTYTFKHWQLKDEMGNGYNEVNPFDFDNTKITKNTTLVAYFKEKVAKAEYTIKHIFEGIAGQINERTEEEKFSAQIGKLVTINQDNRNKTYDQHFTVTDFSETKTVEADGSTVFEIRYARKKYKVNFEVNYNNHFADAQSSQEVEQEIPYEGKVMQPHTNPTLTRTGYTYTFKHWQLKEEMGNDYKEVSPFDFANTKITKNTTLVAYFKEKVAKAEYTIKHIYEGIAGQINERTEEEKFSAQIGKSVTINQDNRNKTYDQHFTVADFAETKTVVADGSTVFEIRYARKKYKVNFEVNYNNHFADTQASQEVEQEIPYEGKVMQPHTNPSLTKLGYTYTFKHWQLKEEMGDDYKEVSPFDFANTKITKNTTLVAYFKETIDRVTYKVVHYLEKTGKDNALNDKYERIVETKTDQKVEDGAVYQDYAALDSQLYEKHTTHSGNKLRAKLTTGDNSVEVCQYYKLKEVQVRFNKTEGIISYTYYTLKVKKTRRVQLPGYTLKDTHFVFGWALSTSGPIQSEFLVEKTTSFLEIYALTDYQKREITYTIKKEKVDGSFEESEEKKTGKISSVHTVSYSNPDNTIYQKPEFDKSSLTVSKDQSQNKVLITIKRKVYDITFEVRGHSSTIGKRTVRHGVTIGKIDETQFDDEGLDIVKTELDGTVKSKTEIEKLVVTYHHKVNIYVEELTKKVGRYPQTKVENPDGIEYLDDNSRKLNFNSNGENYKLNFIRKYYKDSSDNRYEMYNGHYYKFEDVEFAKIPRRNTWFTKKILDFAPFNVSIDGYDDNAKPEHSIFKAMVEEIGQILGVNTFMPTYDDGDFSVKPILDAKGDIHHKLKREPTDYANAVLNQYSEYQPYYRDAYINFLYASFYPRYQSTNDNRWWLGTQYPVYDKQSARSINKNGRLDWLGVHNVFGVVVCIR